MKASQMPYPKPMGARAAVQVAEREVSGKPPRRGPAGTRIIPPENRWTVEHPADACRTCTRFTRCGGACPGVAGGPTTQPVCLETSGRSPAEVPA